jgi:hypothetical protein
MVFHADTRDIASMPTSQYVVGYPTLISGCRLLSYHYYISKFWLKFTDRKDSPFIKIGTRPKLFHLKKLANDDELKLIEQAQGENVILGKQPEYLEKDLHPFLTYYANYYLKAYTKTIQHSKSAKKEFGEWIHPDMVGCYFPIDDWKPEVVEFGAAIGRMAIKLFSFEIKRELTFGNLRESFFQTVSNSSWAHEGYLVAAEISVDEDFQTELRRLSTSFGIGLIKISIEEPDSAEILFPARTSENLDWDTINKLTMNPDFKDFLKRIRIDISSKEIRKEKYDKVCNRDELVKIIKKNT